MSRETIDESRPRGILSQSDREFLANGGEGYSRQAAHERRKAIRERTREALRDFSLLSEELATDEREKIFDAEPRTGDWNQLENDVAATVQFLYMGLGGASGFTQPLKQGVANGEKRISPIVPRAWDLAVRFSINPIRKADVQAVTDHVEEGEWDRLESTDLLDFLIVAMQAGAINFDAVRDELAENDWLQKYKLGKRHRVIPGGHSTPLMDPEVFEQEGIGEMAPEELREMFGEGYPSGLFAPPIYDGEKIFRPPPFGEPDGEIEVIEWIDEPETDKE